MSSLDLTIKKLSIILALCGAIGLILYFTPLGDILKGEVKEKIEKKVEDFKEETKEKIEAKKEEIKEVIEEKKEKIDKEVDKVEKKIDKAEEKIKDLKDLKLKDLIK